MKNTSIFLLTFTTLISACSHMSERNDRLPSSLVEMTPKPIYQLPDFLTDEGRVNLLLTVDEEIPNLLSDAKKYNLNLFELLDIQEKVQLSFFRMKGYREEMNQYRGVQLEINVAPQKVEPFVTYELSDDSYEKFKWYLRDVYSNYKSKELMLKDLRKELLKLKAQSSMGLITGLILSLPEDKRKAAFTIDDKSKLLDYLSKNLPLELDSSFRGADYDLPSKVKRSEALKKLKELEKTEKKVIDLISLGLIFKETGSDNLSSILTLSNDKLKIFSSNEGLAVRINAFKIDTLQSVNQSINKNIHNLLLQNFRSYMHKHQEEKQVDVKAIKIKEVHPALALFRGYVAGDCSTNRSLAIPNLPTERIFFIYDSNGNTKGYLSGHMAKIDNKMSFKLMGLNGAKISARDVRVILEALEISKKQLGVEHIVLPTSDRIIADVVDENTNILINYDTIRIELLNSIKNGKHVDVEYLDESYRNELASMGLKFNDGKYDLMEFNKKGIIYNKNNINLKVSTRYFSSAIKRSESIESQKLVFALKAKKYVPENMFKHYLEASKKESVYLEITDPENTVRKLINLFREEIDLKDISDELIVKKFINNFIGTKDFNEYIQSRDAKFFNGLGSDDIRTVLSKIKNPTFDFVDRLFKEWGEESREVLISYVVSRLDNESFDLFVSKYLKNLEKSEISSLLVIGDGRLSDEFYKEHMMFFIKLDNVFVNSKLVSKMKILDSKELISQIIDLKDIPLVISLINTNIGYNRFRVDKEIINKIIDLNDKNVNRQLLINLFDKEWSKKYENEYKRLIAKNLDSFALQDLLKGSLFFKTQKYDSIVMDKLSKENKNQVSGQSVKNSLRDILLNDQLQSNTTLVLKIVEKYGATSVDGIMDSKLFRDTNIYDPKIFSAVYKLVGRSSYREEFLNTVTLKIFDKYKYINIAFAKDHIDFLNNKELIHFIDTFYRGKIGNRIGDEFSLLKHLVISRGSFIKSNPDLRIKVEKMIDKYKTHDLKGTNDLRVIIKINEIVSVKKTSNLNVNANVNFSCNNLILNIIKKK